MKVRKAIKKIAALGTGATMLGATIFGAAAADLSDYPDPLFIEDGMFDGEIVVGDAAAAVDIIGAVDIATNLQFEAKESVPITVSGVSATTVVEGDAYKISKSSNPLNLREQVDAPIQTVTSDELNALADGTVRNQKGTFTYNQYIDLAASAQADYLVDSDQSDDPNLYLKFDQDTMVYKYKVNFPTALESDVDADGDLDDLDNKKMTLLGKEYTILNTNNATNGELTLELMGGAVQDTMEEYTSKTYTLNGVDYEVEVIAISSAPEVILKVNGEVTDKLTESDTFTLNDGTEIGVKTILENEGTEAGGGDIVEFYLGASKVELQEADWTQDTNGTLTVGQDTMDAFVNIKGTSEGDVVKISEIQVQFNAQEDYYVPVGGKLSEQLDEDYKGNMFLENIDYQFASLDMGDAEEVVLTPSSDNLQVTLTTKTGGEFSFNAMFQDGDSANNVGLGDSPSDLWITDPATNIAKGYFFGLSEDEFSHVMEVDKFDDNDNQVWFEDVASGDVIKVSAGLCNGNPGSYDSELILDGKTYNFWADCDNEVVNFEDFGADNANYGTTNSTVLFTKAGAIVEIGLTSATTGGYVNIYEEERGDETFADYSNSTNVRIDQYSDKEELEIASVNQVKGYGPVMKSWDSKDNYQTGYTDYGTYFMYDTDDNGKLTIQYPSDEAEVAVYVTSGVTTTSNVGESEGGDLTSTTVNAIPVGTAKLASEVSNVAGQNLIVVGGPCVNGVAATLMGRSLGGAGCADGFEEGKAIIKLYENGDNVAMLVAGATGLDTRRACRVLADWDAYNLEGDEMQVVGTSTTFSDTVVSAVTSSIDDEPEEDDMADEGDEEDVE